jgi:chloramphenicol 3-O-phosphotransferase
MIQLSRPLNGYGQARDQQARVLQNASYDLRVDTHALTLDECVDRVVALLPSSER